MRIASLFLVPMALYGAASAAEAQRPSAQEYLFPKDGGMYVGADYYPEHWPQERWETDLRMMKEAGFNIVRVAEFSWVLFEPEEGKYEFDWLDRWLKLAEQVRHQGDRRHADRDHAGVARAQVSGSAGDESDRPAHRVGRPAAQLLFRQGLSPALRRRRPRARRALRQPSIDRRLADRQRIRQRRLPLRQVPGQFPALAGETSTAIWPS